MNQRAHQTTKQVTAATRKQPKRLKLISPKHKGNSAESILRLRQLICDLINEVESLDQSSLSPKSRLPEYCDSLNFYEEVARFEIALIKSALRKTNGHQIQAARLLNMHPSTLNAKIKQYDLRHQLGHLLY